ncbi:hypothetical protein ACFTSF_03765 [Kribbella sp. NPDC056951]|uniref:hypothetical protein n=1 Tax=Kribbella sp. NPDC056951 TaxID=3345978 RepID=UPI0036341E47
MSVWLDARGPARHPSDSRRRLVRRNDAPLSLVLSVPTLALTINQQREILDPKGARESIEDVVRRTAIGLYNVPCIPRDQVLKVESDRRWPGIQLAHDRNSEVSQDLALTP